MQTVCSSTFGRKITKSLLSTVCWSGRLYSCLISTLHRDVASGMKWRRLRWFSPSPTAYIVCVYYLRRIFDFPAHRKEVGGFWHLYKQDMRPLHLFCKISFFQKSFVGELAEKWLFCTKSVHDHVTATPATLEHTVTRIFADLPQIRHFWSWIRSLGRGEDGLGRHLVPPPPTSGNSSFCLILLNYKTSVLFSWCQLSLLKQHIFLILTQPSRDGYLLLYSSKSSMHGTRS